MTLLQLRRAIAAIPSAYDNATVFVSADAPRSEATTLLMFASADPQSWSEATVWISDSAELPSGRHPSLIIMPGVVYR